jgi:sterol desaturase/sphingolipid hydroxylase (fatty acid hydroxylase superfamily)
LQAVIQTLVQMAPMVLLFSVGAIIPFAVLEQIRPVGERPRVRAYMTNILVSVSGLVLSYPFGVLAGLWSGQVRAHLPWHPISFSFSDIGKLPTVGPTLEVLAMIVVPLILHEGWFYFAHRLEHRVPLLWEFHKIHHSDENMNVSTYERDHFLQTAFRAFFSVFTLGLVFDLELTDAGQAAFYSSVFLSLWSMFYHSAIRIELPWLDQVLMTPQVHRLHHSADPAHHNRNFADVFPVFDIVFGTFLKPNPGEWAKTGLGAEFPPPRSWWRAQLAPLISITRYLTSKAGRAA